jgi:hypothetical protein
MSLNAWCALAAYFRKREHDNYGRGEKVSDPKVKEIGDSSVASSCAVRRCWA